MREVGEINSPLFDDPVDTLIEQQKMEYQPQCYILICPKCRTEHGHFGQRQHDAKEECVANKKKTNKVSSSGR